MILNWGGGDKGAVKLCAMPYLVVGRTLLTNKNMAFSLGRLILLRMMYMN